MPRLNAAANSPSFGTNSLHAQESAASLDERKALFAKIAQSGVPKDERDAYFVELAGRMSEKSLVRICENLRPFGEEALWLLQIFSLELQSFRPETQIPQPAPAVQKKRTPTAVKKPKPVAPTVVAISGDHEGIKKQKAFFQRAGRPYWPTPTDTEFGAPEKQVTPGRLIHRAAPGRY